MDNLFARIVVLPLASRTMRAFFIGLVLLHRRAQGSNEGLGCESRRNLHDVPALRFEVACSLFLLDD